jgi:sporulation integral membrane protein YlbJ
VYAISAVSGYPVGAKTTAELYENKIISRGQACKITTFTSTSGPLFIIGSVGVGMFNNAKLGYLILICHILGAFINGIIYRNTFESSTKPLVYSFTNNNILEDNMYNSIKSILIVGGYVAIFYMLISMFNNYNLLYPFSKFLSLIFNCNINISSAIINGLIEITRGCKDLSVLQLTTKQALVISTGLISFGGISIFVQALTFLNKFKISLKYYLCSKLTQTLISIIIALIMGNIFF